MFSKNLYALTRPACVCTKEQCTQIQTHLGSAAAAMTIQDYVSFLIVLNLVHF